MHQAQHPGIRVHLDNYKNWYGWRKDHTSEKYKNWIKKIAQTIIQNTDKRYRERRLKKQKQYTRSVQRSRFINIKLR